MRVSFRFGLSVLAVPGRSRTTHFAAEVPRGAQRERAAGLPKETGGPPLMDYPLAVSRPA